MGGYNKDFKNEAMSSKEVTKEKIHYIGDLRIIGKVTDINAKDNVIGYVVMVEKTQQFKMYTVGQTMILLNKFKFVNAKISNGKIVNTECSMDRLPKFNTNMQVIDNHGITILGEITEGDSKVGYRAMDTNARVVDLSEDELIMLGLPLINGKIVKGVAGKKTHISGIKQEFTKIEKSKLPEIEVKKPNKWVREMHAKKLFDVLLPSCIKWGVTGKNNINDNWYYRTLNKDGYRYIDLDREAKIIVSEVLTEKNGITISDSDKDMIKRIIKELPHKHELVIRYDPDKKYKPDENDKLFLFALAQFILYNKQKCADVIKMIQKRNVFNFTMAEKLADKGLATDILKKLVVKCLSYSSESRYKREPEVTEAIRKKMFNTRTFTTGEEAAQLGFALSESNKDIQYETKYGFHKTLKYIGDYFEESLIPCDYNEYKKESRCLGDILAIANILKLINKILSPTSVPAWNKEASKESARYRASIEMIIAIAYMYESKAMKKFVDNYKDDLDKIDVSVPNYDEVSSTDYKLSPVIKMYYASGFNVFLNDNNYRDKSYTKLYLQKAELINYRQYGNMYNIQHPMLKEELASIVTMVTNSKYCDAESVEDYIGRIRFL